MDISEVRPLPPNKGIIDVFADFLRYLLLCIKTHIKTTHLDGESLWDSLEGEVRYVLSHPNGWEGREQDDMRKAAIQAGLVPETKEGKARLSFVTEGEASLHFAVHNGLQAQAMIVSLTWILCDRYLMNPGRRRRGSGRCWRRNDRCQFILQKQDYPVLRRDSASSM